jgi:hypothetical protein
MPRGMLDYISSPLVSVFEPADAALELVLDYIRPQPFDDPGIVVAIRKVVIQSREVMALTGSLHGRELRLSRT